MSLSVEEKAAQKFLTDSSHITIGINDNDPERMEMLFKEVFIAGIRWERRRLRPKFSKIFEEVIISMHYEEEE